MKNLKKYIFMMIAMFLMFFAANDNVVKADGEEGTPVVLEDVVINANSTGVASDVYEVKVKVEDGSEEGQEKYIIVNKQYTRTRDITITLNIDEETLLTYDTKFDVCETIPEGTAGNVREEQVCAYYSTTAKVHNFQLSGRNDGEKHIKIIFYSNYANKAVSKSYEKAINLDTTGPVITLTNGEYIFLPAGNKYTEPGATCEDDSGIVNEGGCVVEFDKNPQINMQKSGYQYLRYTAKDFLGNEVNVLRKVMVEVAPPKEGIDYYWFFAIGFVVIVAGFLGYTVIKNKDKQKNQSVL